MNAARSSLPSSIAPPSGMLAPVVPGEYHRFALACDSWRTLLAFVGAAAELPATPAGFEARYGAPPASIAAGACFEAIKRVRAAAGDFGNPRTLRSALRESPALLDAWEAPAEIVTHTAWLARRVADAAGMIASGIESAVRDLPGQPAGRQLEAIQTWLFDRALGPAPLSKAVAGEVEALRAKFGTFRGEIARCNEILAACADPAPSTPAALASELRELAASLPRAAGAIASFVDRLLLLEAAWIQVHIQMLAIGSGITRENVGALPFLDPSRARLAVGVWKSVGHAGRRFAGSLGCDDEPPANRSKP